MDVLIECSNNSWPQCFRSSARASWNKWGVVLCQTNGRCTCYFQPARRYTCAKARDTSGRCIAIFWQSIAVRGRCDSPEFWCFCSFGLVMFARQRASWKPQTPENKKQSGWKVAQSRVSGDPESSRLFSTDTYSFILLTCFPGLQRTCCWPTFHLPCLLEVFTAGLWWVSLARGLFSPSNPPNCRNKQRILERGAFVFCTILVCTKPWFKRDPSFGDF